MKFFDIFKGRRQPAKGLKRRRFVATANGRLNNYIYGVLRINGDLKQDYYGLVLRARDMAKNDEFIGGYLKNLDRNVIGAGGFQLRCRSVAGEDKEAAQIGKQIEKLWRQYQKKSTGAVTSDGTQGGRDFDMLLLRTLVTDGEVFIRKHVDNMSEFGIRYSVIDSLDVDYLYNAELGDGERIVMGIRVDADGVPISYFVRESATDYYNSGARYEIPADQIIHIFRKYCPGQVRGYTMTAAAILNINHLNAYEEAELVAARLQSCQMVIYERTGPVGNSILDDDEDTTPDGLGVLTNMEPGAMGIAPDGCVAKQLQNQHPSSNFGLFVKNILRRVANCLGISYNKATQDYESVNFSSLREAALEDREGFLELQEFLIENWKEYQFKNFLDGILLNSNIRITDVSRIGYQFIGRRFEWVDPVKDLTVIKMKLELRLSDPITEIEKLGEDPDDVLDRWVQWNEMIAARRLGTVPESSGDIIDAVVQNELITNKDEV